METPLPALVKISRLKKRREFVRVNRERRMVVMSTVIVQVLDRETVNVKESMLPPLRIGFTVSRKVGNAVKRNRARRRMRALVDIVLPLRSFDGQDMVLIARPQTITADFSALLYDFKQALNRLGL